MLHTINLNIANIYALFFLADLGGQWFGIDIIAGETLLHGK